MEEPKQQLDQGLVDRPLALAPIQPGALCTQLAGLLYDRQRPQHKLTRKDEDGFALTNCERLPPACLHFAIGKRGQGRIEPVQTFLHARYSVLSV